MQRTLGHLSFVGIYLDDIIIFSELMEEHKRHLELVLNILAKDGLIANGSKCTFGVSEVTFCGFVISNGTIKMEPSKVAAVQGWLEPKTISELRGFLGFKFLPEIFKAHWGYCGPSYRATRTASRVDTFSVIARTATSLSVPEKTSYVRAGSFTI